VSPYTGYLIETFVTLAGVCALAVAVLWAARRLGVARSSGPVELRGYLPLDARHSIALVKVGATVFVVGVGEGGFTKLGELPDADLPAPRRAAALTFAQAFARIRGSAPGIEARSRPADRGAQTTAATRPLPADPHVVDPADEA
jgi:flagellar biogenesis protein FliO